MKATPLRSALQYAGWFLVGIFFVALLSFIFSFLGTIFCAALAGMMLAATRQARWLALPVSLLFPAVIFIMLQVTHAELSKLQINIVSALCGGAFWLSYVMTALVLRMERKGRAREAASGARGGEAERPQREEQVQADASCEASQGPAASRPLSRLNLEVLQGRWRCESNGAGEGHREKVLTIQDTQVVLTITNGNGKAFFAAKAELKLPENGVSSQVVLSDAGGTR